jgi:hypothetical protein
MTADDRQNQLGSRRTTYRRLSLPRCGSGMAGRWLVKEARRAGCCRIGKPKIDGCELGLNHAFGQVGDRGMHPKNWNRRWLFWQVFAPIVGPILISALAVLFWESIEPTFKTKWDVIVDVTPWALTFYTITLIGATMNDLWPKLGDHPTLGVSILIVGFSVGLYAALIVIRRHDPTFVPGTQGYTLTLILLILSVILCHQATKA